MSQYSDSVKIAYDKGYYVDKSGNVFYHNKQRKLTDYQGYKRFNIRHNGKVIRVKVHQLQAYQKYGNELFNDNIVVRHLNGNPSDNSYDNIAIGTASDNMMDIPEEIRKQKALHATSFTIKYNHRDIYDFYIKTKSYKQTMEKFGIKSKNTINQIRIKFK